MLFNDDEGDQISYGDPNSMCIRCGHCIARCPEDAILFEDMGDSHTFEGINNPEEIINFDEMYKFFQGHRSIRQYKNQEVPKEVLQKLFNAMQWAPTGRNMRSESFTVISDKEKLKELSDAIQETLTNDKAWGWLYGERLANLAKQFDIPVYFDAPHLIIVSSQLPTVIGNQNVANLVTYGRLAAHSLGLGTCWNGWTQVGIELNPKIMRIAGVRAKAFGAFTVGYPDYTLYRIPPRPYKRIKGI
jgi:nitroreductase